MKTKQIRSSAWDMTQGNPGLLLLKFSIPLLIGSLFQELYSLVDSIIIGRFVGENEFGGIGCTGSIHYLIFSVGYGISAGIGVLVSMMFGAGEKERLTKAIYNSTWVLLAGSLFITAVGFFGAPAILTLMRTPPELLPHAITYLQIVSLGSLGTIFYNGISGIMRAFGDSKTPLVILLFACVLNIVLDLVFVLVLHWDVAGVALATTIANLLSAVISYLAAVRRLPLCRYQKGALKPDGILLKRCVGLAGPLVGQNMLIALSCMVLQYVVNGFGPVIATANTAVSKVEQVIQRPFGALATGMSTYTGQNVGANRPDRVRQGLIAGAKYVIGFSLVMLVVMQLFGENILSIFNDNAEIISVGATALRITSCFYGFLGLLYVVRGVLNGAGDAAYSTINGVVEILCRCLLAAPLTMIPFVGQWGVFLCSGCTWMITSLISLGRYARGSWKKYL